MPYSAAYPKGHVLQPGDPPEMTAAIVWLSRQRIGFARVSPHQLKIGRTLSFYPVKGTLMHDGQRPLPQRGLAGLQELLGRPDTADEARQGRAPDAAVAAGRPGLTCPAGAPSQPQPLPPCSRTPML